MDPAWYALAVHVRSEQRATAELARRGVEVFLPTRRVRRPWSDRIRVSDEPLFPGYLFVQVVLDAGRRVDLLRVKGVYDLVGRTAGDASIARAVPDEQVGALRRVVQAEREIDPIAHLVRGVRVEVAAGSLRGAQGVVVQEADGQRRLVINVDLLGRAARCVLSADDVLVAREPRQAEAA